jgi:uridine kinase
MKDGYDPNAIRNPRLKDDLSSLLRGDAITYPVENKVFKAGKYILLEEPSGREREEIRELIDQVIYIDVPQDVCVIRMIQRVIDMDVWETEGTYKNEPKEEIVHQLDSIAGWINQYQRARSMYLSVSEAVKRNSDMVVNGQTPVEETVNEIVDKLMRKP